MYYLQPLTLRRVAAEKKHPSFLGAKEPTLGAHPVFPKMGLQLQNRPLVVTPARFTVLSITAT